jgi:hypothetical protein
MGMVETGENESGCCLDGHAQNWQIGDKRCEGLTDGGPSNAFRSVYNCSIEAVGGCSAEKKRGCRASLGTRRRHLVRGRVPVSAASGSRPTFFSLRSKEIKAKKKGKKNKRPNGEEELLKKKI